MKVIMGNIFLSILTGILLALSFPNVDWYILAWVAFVPLLFVIFRVSVLQSLFYGWISGLAFTIITLSWFVSTYNSPMHSNIKITGISVLIFLWLYIALYIGVWSVLTNIVKKHINSVCLVVLFGSSLWASLDYIKVYILTGFPWSVLGYSQYKFTSMIQIADFSGVYGVSFLIVLFNLCIYFWISNIKSIKNLAFLVVGLVFFCSSYFYGVQKMSVFKNFGGERLKAVIIQPYFYNLLGRVSKESQETESMYHLLNNYSFAEMRKHVEAVSGLKPDVIIWPESVIARMRDIKDQKKATAIGKFISDLSGTFNLMGSSYLNKNLRFNAVLAFDGKDKGSTTVGIHLKNKLAIFGEYFPYKELFDALNPAIAKLYKPYRVYPGNDANILGDGKLAIGSLICAENLDSDMSIRFVENGAKVLTSQSNDAWSKKTKYMYQHFAVNAFRAIETRKDILVSANTGISGIISCDGRIKKMLRPYISARLIATFRQNNFETIYVKIGDLFAKLCLLATVLFLLYLFRLLSIYLSTILESEEPLTLNEILRRLFNATREKR
jgi:apolipoprotein N-acyltransferase